MTNDTTRPDLERILALRAIDELAALTPAAKNLLAKAQANGGSYARPTYGPMTQLVEAGLATTIEQAGATILLLTTAGQEA